MWFAIEVLLWLVNRSRRSTTWKKQKIRDRDSALVAQLVDRLGGDGFWKRDYGWGVRVRRPFGARGMSSIRYGTRLGDLKESVHPTQKQFIKLSEPFIISDM